MKRLDGRVALITGAASGIGRASAKLFAGEGAKVLVVDRADEIQDTVAMIKQAGGTVLGLKMDASLEADVSDAVDRAVSEFGTLDVVYANAGVSGGFRNFLELSAKDWMDVLSVNLVGVYLAIKHAARVMVPNKKGAIVCTASAERPTEAMASLMIPTRARLLFRAALPPRKTTAFPLLRARAAMSTVTLGRAS